MRNFSKYVLAFLALAFLVVAFLLVKPYIISILTALIIAYICHPFYLRLKKRVRKDWLASLIISLLIILIVLIPFIMVINFATQETRSFYLYARQFEFKEPSSCDDENTFSCTVLSVLDHTSESELRSFIMDILKKLSDFLITEGSQFIMAIPSVVLNIFITIFIIYYLLKDGEVFMRNLREIVPIAKNQFEDLRTAFDSMIQGIVYGQLIISLIQGALAAIGFWIAGIDSVIFLGLLTAVFSLIPMVGTAVVWVPASAFLFINGLMNDSNVMIAKAIFLFIYGIVIVSTVDNLLRPKLISEQTKVHPVLILLGVLGGLELFGIFGFILGPVVLTASILLIEILKRDIVEAKG